MNLRSKQLPVTICESSRTSGLFFPTGDHVYARQSLNLPIGLQRYTVGNERYTDPAGTLRGVAASGYKTSGASRLPKHRLKTWEGCWMGHRTEESAGPYCVPIYRPSQEKVELAVLLLIFRGHSSGEEFMVVTCHWVCRAVALKPDPQAGSSGLLLRNSRVAGNGLEMNAEQFNKGGEQIKTSRNSSIDVSQPQFEWTIVRA